MWFSKTDFIWFNYTQINLSRPRPRMTLTRRNTGRGWCPSELSGLWFIAVWHFQVISSVSLCAPNCCCLSITEFTVIYKSFSVRCLQWKYEDWDTLGICNFIAEKKIHYQHILQTKLHFGVGRVFFLTPFPWTAMHGKPEEPAPALLIVCRHTSQICQPAPVPARMEFYFPPLTCQLCAENQ